MESVWWPRAAGGMVAVLGMARRSFDGRSLTSSRNATASDSTRRPRPARADRSRRRARLLRGDVPRRHRARVTASRRSSSRTTTRARARARCAASTSRRIPGRASSSGWRAGRVLDVVVDLRRGSPTFGEWEGVELDDDGRRDAVDPGRVRARVPGAERGRGLRLQVHELLRPGDRGGHPLRRSGGRHRVAVARSSCCIRERDADGAARWPRSRTRCRSRCERALRTVADGRPAPRQPAHRAAGVAVRALGGRRAFVVRVEDLDAGRVRPGFVPEQLADLRGDRARLGRAGVGAVRAHRAYYETRWRGCRSTSASARGPRSARARRRRTGRSGVYPGTCLRLSRGRARGAARRGPRAGAAGARRRGAGALRRPGARARRPASSTTSSCAATTARSPTTSRSSSTTPAQGVEEVVRGADCVDSTPRQIWLARALGVPAPAYAHVPLVLGADGRRLAKRHGDVTLREVEPRRRGGVDGGFARVSRGGTPRELLDGFDPDALPREPTTLSPP